MMFNFIRNLFKRKRFIELVFDEKIQKDYDSSYPVRWDGKSKTIEFTEIKIIYEK